MDAAMLGAIAAVLAAIIGLTNVYLTARLGRKQDTTKWTRDLLPDLVRELGEAFHHQYGALFYADWKSIAPEDREAVGMPEFVIANDLAQRLEVFASPETIATAGNVQLALENMRFFFLERGAELDKKNREKWSYYWAYAEASHAFLVAARKEMGLKPPPVPGGLARHREDNPEAKKGKFRRQIQRGRYSG
jgi:hypothetical protein